MNPAEYLYAARMAFSKREPEHGQALCETLLKEFPDSPEAKDANYLLKLREYAAAPHTGSPPTPPQQLDDTDKRQLGPSMRIVTTALGVGFIFAVGSCSRPVTSYFGVDYPRDYLALMILPPMLGFFGTLVGTPIGAVWSAFHSGERRIRTELWWLGGVWGLSLLLTLGLVTAGALVVQMISLQGLVVASGAFLLFSSTTRKNLPQPARKYGPVLLGAAVLILLISMFHVYIDTAVGLWEEWLIIAGVTVGVCVFIGTRASDGERS